LNASPVPPTGPRHIAISRPLELAPSSSRAYQQPSPPSLSAAPFGQVATDLWFYIECGPLTVGSNDIKDVADSLVTEFGNRGVLGVRCTRRKRIASQPYLGCLYFKSVLQRDSLLVHFLQGIGQGRFQNVRGSTADGVPQPYAAPVDLLYVDEVYACAGSEQERDALLACGPAPIKTPEDFKIQILDYVRHPPRLPADVTEFPPADVNARKRNMQLIEFTTSWLIKRIEHVDNAPIELKRLEILLRTHGRNGFRKAFITPIWPNTGQINTFIRQIARWAETDGLKQHDIRSESRESIGFTLHRCWRLTLEMDLPEPYFLKDPREAIVPGAGATQPTGPTLSSLTRVS
jgi:hypothetical protein